ncbi:MAG TPA: carboxypeptidase-like regulatory domain-containing protein [Pyrinomonadaceae bacterium]|jgi:tetratricopeptide (TPR) repeat protein|nr:carboxypeptidase-like regulatory domain-containing protein [Pyrinomonadaceae bacterium]
MFRRYLLPFLASVTLIALVSIAASAQIGQLRGHVTLKQADGTVVPAAGALVDVFRVDMTGKYDIKTDKRGEFVFAGMFLAGDYIITASMPGAQPSYVPGVRAGRDVDYPLELVMPGDGKRLTLAEAKSLAANKTPSGGGGGGGARESAEDKAKTAEILKKNAEITANNKKVEEANAVVERTFKAGNAALNAKNYDLAIAQYDEGLSADPEQPSLLTNKSMALNSRAVEKYNTGIKAADDAAKTAGMEAAKKDWTDSAQTAVKAVTMLKAIPTSTDPTEASRAKSNLYYALLTRANATRFFVVKVDQSQLDLGVTAFEEYLAAESDRLATATTKEVRDDSTAKKARAEHDMAQMLFDANAFDRALVAYQKILEANPDDLDALLRSGQALFNIGAINTDKAKYQEAANYLAKFVEKAPDSDPFKADAKAILDTLKDQANVKPEKLATPTRRARKP